MFRAACLERLLLLDQAVIPDWSGVGFIFFNRGGGRRVWGRGTSKHLQVVGGKPFAILWAGGAHEVKSRPLTPHFLSRPPSFSPPPSFLETRFGRGRRRRTSRLAK